MCKKKKDIRLKHHFIFLLQRCYSVFIFPQSQLHADETDNAP